MDLTKDILPSDFAQGTGTALRTLGRTSARVVFTGSTAYTDMQGLVVLPALDRAKPIKAADAAILRGYCDHEACHDRHTEFPVWKGRIMDARRQLGDKRGMTFKQIANSVEDMRIERCQTSIYPGVQKNLQATVDSTLIESLQDADLSPNGDGRAWLAVAITWIGRKHAGFDATLLDQAIARLPAKLRAYLPAIARELDKLPLLSPDTKPLNGKAGTGASFDLAEKLMALMNELEPEQSPQQPQPDGPQGRPREQGRPQGKGQAQDKPQEKGEDSDDPLDDLDDDSQRGGGDQEDGDQGGDESDDEGDEPGKGQRRGRGAGDASPKDAIEQGTGIDGEGDEGQEEQEPELELPKRDVTVHAGAGEFDGNTMKSADLNVTKVIAPYAAPSKGAYIPYTTAEDLYVRKDGSYREDGALVSARRASANSTAEHYNLLIEKGRATISIMKRQVERELLAQRRVQWNGGRHEGRLDGKRLVAASSGRQDVVKVKQEAPYLDTAVAMLVDHSGSMSGDKIMTAATTAIYLAECFETAAIPFEVLGFRSDHLANGHNLGPEIQRYSRICQQYFIEYKTFAERLRDCREMLAAMQHAADDFNCDGEAVWWAYRRLLRRPEKRKLLMVLSDGQPCLSVQTKMVISTIDHVRHVTKIIQNDPRTDLLGVGIMCDVSSYYKNNVQINDVSELPTVLSRHLRGRLLESF